MRVLLLGASGQLGQHITPLFSDLVALPHSQLDLTEAAALSQALLAHRPQVVINAAAYTAVDRAEDEREQAFAINCEAPAQLARECQRLGLPLVHFSTDYVFPGSGNEAWSEDDPCAPVNQYGASKWAGEEQVRQHCERHLIVRVSWLFSSRGQNFVKTILRLASEREQLRIVSDQRGCPTWCGHLAAIVPGLLDSQRWGTYHYCDGPATNWWEFTREIVEQARRQGWSLKVREVEPVSTAEVPTSAARPACSVLNCNKLKGLGIEQADWREGLRRTLQELGPA